MDPNVPKKEQNQPRPDEPAIPQKHNEPAPIGGRPPSHLEAGGSTLEGLQAANNIPRPIHLGEEERSAIITDLHKKDQAIPSVRTLESDAAEAVKQQNISAVSIASKKIQQKSPIDTAASSEQSSDTHISGIFKKIALILGVFLLIGASVGVIGYAFFVTHRSSPSSHSNTSPNTLINIDETKTIVVVPGQNTLSAWLDTKNKLANDTATIVQLLITQSGTTTPLDSQTFLSELGAQHIPSWFIRAIGQQYMVGFYNNNSQWDPFLILSVTSYDNAFAGMLQWENGMATDLAPLYTSTTPKVLPTQATSTIASTTSTTSPQTVTLSLSPTFTDMFISNKNVRVLAIPGQKPLLLYSFPQQNVLVITTSAAAMNEIFNRLVSRQFVH